MKTLKIFSLFVVSCILMNTNTQAQAPVPPEDIVKYNVRPPSPNVAALGKYGEVPVSLFTGSPSISIPLFQIEEGNITVPISLSYNASGIKVDEVASWAGLGWSFNAGGVIGRTVRGKEDETGYLTGNSYNIPSIIPLPQTQQELEEHLTKLKLLSKGTEDWIPDLFSFNFCNYGGKFTFEKTTIDNANSLFRVTHSAEHNNLDITFIKDIPGLGGVHIFRATDAQGNTYYFETKEETLGSTNHASEAGAKDFNLANTSGWHLTKIVSADTKNSVTFSYEDNIVDYRIGNSESKTCDNLNIREGECMFFEGHPNNGQAANCNQSVWGVDCAVNSTSVYMRQRVKQKLLKSIISEKYIIEINPPSVSVAPNIEYVFSPTELAFLYDRKDLYDKDISTGNPSTLAKKLGLIAIYTNIGTKEAGEKGDLVKGYVMNYDYYYDGDNLTNPAYDELKYRLRLLGVQEFYQNQNPMTLETLPAGNPNPYILSYNSNILPKRLSKSQDHWGFYNNKSNTTLIPRELYIATNTYYGYDLSGGNRTTNSTTVTQGMLASVIYPTKGKTVFDFECNEAKYIDDVAFWNLDTPDKTVNVFSDGHCPGPGGLAPANLYSVYLEQQLDNCGVPPLCEENCPPVAPQNKIKTFTTGTIMPKRYAQTTVSHNAVMYVQTTGWEEGKTLTGYILFQNGQIYKSGVFGPGDIDPIYFELQSNTTYTIWVHAVLGEAKTINLTINYRDRQIPVNMYVGGARIKEIKNYTSTNSTQPISVKHYYYNNPTDGASYGKLFNVPYYSYVTKNSSVVYTEASSPSIADGWSCIKTCTHLNRSSGAVNLYANSDGTHIGYEKVIEKELNSANEDLGYVESKFYTDVNTFYQIRYPVANLTNGDPLRGKLLEEKSFKRIGITYYPKKTITNQYTVYSKYNSLTRSVYLKNPGYDLLPTIEEKIASFVDNWFDVQSNFTALTKSTVVEYDDNNQNRTTVTDYTYGVNSHLLLNEEKTTLPDATILTNTYKYPLDIILPSTNTGSYADVNGLVALKDKHILSSIIEKRIEKSRTGLSKSVISSQYVEYNADKLKPSVLYKTETTQPMLSTGYTIPALSGNAIVKDIRFKPISYYNYDSNNNISEMHGLDGVSKSYIWSLPKDQVYAEILNANPAEVFYSGFEETANVYTFAPAARTLQGTIKAKTGQYYLKLENSSISLLNVPVVNRIYTLSFWVRAISGNTITITKNNGQYIPTSLKNSSQPDADGWRYVEYQLAIPANQTLNITSTNTFSQGGDASTQIDEIRLYPSDAQVSTFTYNKYFDLYQVMDNNNFKATYEYDPQLRLKAVRDDDDKLLKSFKYNYRPQ